jgi:Single-stranded DNA-binding protein
MLSALASGQIVRAPKHGTSASGTRWANATMRCSTGTDREGAALTAFITIAAFNDQADQLAKLGQGDAVSVSGALKQTHYTTDAGELRHGLEIVANGILTTYQVRQRRGDENASGKPSGKKQWTGSREDRFQADAYRDFARQAAGPAHDNSFDSEVPF